MSFHLKKKVKKWINKYLLVLSYNTILISYECLTTKRNFNIFSLFLSLDGSVKKCQVIHLLHKHTCEGNPSFFFFSFLTIRQEGHHFFFNEGQQGYNLFNQRICRKQHPSETGGRRGPKHLEFQTILLEKNMLNFISIIFLIKKGNERNWYCKKMHHYIIYHALQNIYYKSSFFLLFQFTYFFYLILPYFSK